MTIEKNVSWSVLNIQLMTVGEPVPSVASGSRFNSQKMLWSALCDAVSIIITLYKYSSQDLRLHLTSATFLSSKTCPIQHNEPNICFKQRQMIWCLHPRSHSVLWVLFGTRRPMWWCVYLFLSTKINVKP